MSKVQLATREERNALEENAAVIGVDDVESELPQAGVPSSDPPDPVVTSNHG